MVDDGDSLPSHVPPKVGVYLNDISTQEAPCGTGGGSHFFVRQSLGH